jgi:hypothetical protein
MTQNLRKLTPEHLFKLRQIIKNKNVPDEHKRKAKDLLAKHDEFLTQERGKISFLDFVKHVYPGYKVGPHHLKLAQIFEDIAAGKKKRVIVNIAPRHGKSELISYLAPAWFLGKYPQKKVIMASHTADLAVNFGRRVRNLVGSESYKGIFPQIELQADSKSASRWGTNFNGEYFAIGVGGALAGRGADLFIIDDPHSEQEAKTGRPDVFLPAWEWFQSGPLQRLMPGGAIIVVMTRWSKLDLTGQIVKQQDNNEEVDKWEVVEFPAIKDDGEALWPEFWPVEELLAKKAALDIRYWNAQYMQNPVSEEGALIKREWWNIWEKDDPPECEFTIMSLDAAQEATNRADYNALTVRGVSSSMTRSTTTTSSYSIPLKNGWSSQNSKSLYLRSTKNGSQMRSWLRKSPTGLRYTKSCVVWVYPSASSHLAKVKIKLLALMLYQTCSQAGLSGRQTAGGRRK